MVNVRPRLKYVPMDDGETLTFRNEAEKWKKRGAYGKAWPMYARLTTAGDENARFECAQMLFNGWGTKENKAAALVLFSGLATERFPLLNFYLGLYYEQGLFVVQDYEKAFRYYTAGAEAGDVLCLTQLGTMYGKGNYVDRDPERAAEFYRRASNAGDILGTANLGWCYANGEGVEMDLKKAKELYEIAAAGREEHAVDELAHFDEYYGRPDGEK